jgi:uncharacterized membrane protein YfcA
MMTENFLIYVAAGFAAQMIDGTLGMAYGVTASTMLLSIGLPPAAVSATVHAAECFTTGVSAVSHRAFGNVNGQLFRRLLVPGIAGAIVGAYILSELPGDQLRPYSASYLLIMGLVILVKAFGRFPSQRVSTYLIPLAFAGAFIDAIGGGGWGPIVATTLIVRGNSLREAVGSVNAVEFFVTVAASLTFLVTVGISHWQVILALALGGLLAAPMAAWACTRLPTKPFMVLVGLLIVGLSIRTLLKVLGTA